MTRLDEYTESQIQTMLTEDPSVAEQGISVSRRENTLILSGEVLSAERREHIKQLVASRFPGVNIRCEIAVSRTGEPEDVEEVS